MTTPSTLLAASAALRNRDLTPPKLVADCLDRINRFESQVHAWVHVDAAGATHAAQQLAQELAAGKYRGPLHGIPLGIKDIVDVAGWPTRSGSPITDTAPAAEDAPVVARLRAAGAIILGKTVTTEFACFDPPPTRNPWNLAHTPGGSSSGSAAAVALGMCLGAIGSQTGGSIIRPASYCGIAGCKPTFGRVSRRGVTPVSFHLDHVGPLARTAADCAVLLAAIAGDDPRDPGSIPHEPMPEVQERDIRAPRLAIMRPYFFEPREHEAIDLALRAVARLTERGAELIDLPLPAGFDQMHTMHRRLMAAEPADFHARRFGYPRDGYGPNMAAQLAEGAAISMADYQEALRHQAAFQNALARLLHGIDALVVPATPGAAPDVKTTGDPRFNWPFSYAHVPVVSIPCGLTAAGLPVSLQFAGARWSEARVLETAIWAERILDFRHRPPLLSA